MRALTISMWAAILLSAGCYHPKIDDGALHCGLGGICPDGYTCSEMVCVHQSGGLDLGGSGPLFSGMAGPLDLSAMSGVVQCSTKTGEIKLPGGTSIIPPFADMMSGFRIVSQTSGPPVAIWSFSSINVPASVTLKPTSDSNDTLPVFASSGDITIDGGIDWRGFGGVAGAAGMPGKDLMTGVAAGGAGGSGDGGGGGGGHADVGGTGAGASGGVGGASYGTPDLMPVFDGSGGGGGGNVGGQGGNGGGSIIVISAQSINVSGKLDVSGNAGNMASSAGGGGGGGGGGSGGSILLSAATVNLNPGHELVALGGKGGAGVGTGAAGGDGASGRIWVGGNIVASGGIVATPTATTAATPVAMFP